MDKSKYYLADKEIDRTAAYSRVFAIVLVMRFVALIVSCLLMVKPAIVFEVFSVLFYISGLVIIRRTKHPRRWFYMFWVEFVLNIVFCNQFFGWRYGFTLYGIMLIPVLFYMSYAEKEIENEILISIILSVIEAVLVLGSSVFDANDNKLGYVPEPFVAAVFCINFVLCSIALIFYFSHFILDMKMTTETLHIKNEALDFLANYDELTKLRNRHTMAKIFQEFEKRDRMFCVVLGDIDDFKKINDTYGHACGDQVLIEISEILRYSVGKDGVVCRWGGEEILILLDMEIEESYKKIESIRHMIEQFCIEFENNKVNVTMTFGFSYRGEGANTEKLVALSDNRLYYGKKHGKNQVVRESYL